MFRSLRQCVAARPAPAMPHLPSPPGPDTPVSPRSRRAAPQYAARVRRNCDCACANKDSPVTGGGPGRDDGGARPADLARLLCFGSKIKTGAAGNKGKSCCIKRTVTAETCRVLRISFVSGLHYLEEDFPPWPALRPWPGRVGEFSIKCES